MKPAPSSELVLDSWSILAYLEGEEAGTAVSDLILKALAERTHLLVTTVNLGEVWYILARKTTFAAADAAISDLRKLGFLVMDADWQLSRRAAEFKVAGRISFADCFAAALASIRRIPLVTGDPEFRQVKKEIEIRWLQSP